MGAVVKDFVVSQIGEACHTSLLEDFTFEQACVEKGIAKALGLAIILGAFVVKVPQLLAVVRAQSLAGVSVWAVLLEAVSNAWYVTYGSISGFAFSAYGEGFAIFGQNVILLLLFLVLPAGRAGASGGARSLGAFELIVFFGLTALPLALALFVVPDMDAPRLWALLTRPAGTDMGLGPEAAATLQSLVRAVFLGGSGLFALSRLQQVVALCYASDAGSLSGLTSFLQFAGVCARVFTALKDAGGDKALLLSTLSAATLNGTVFFQWLYLTMQARSKEAKEKKEE